MGLNIDFFIPSFARQGFRIGAFKEPFSRYLNYRSKLSWFSDPRLVGSKVAALGQQLDFVLIGQDEINTDQLQFYLSNLISVLHKKGQISIVFNRFSPDDQWLDHLDQWIARLNLLRYHTGRIGSRKVKNLGYGIVLVNGHYNPVVHARELTGTGSPDLAIDILKAVPSDMIPDKDILLRLILEQQNNYLVWQKLQHGKCPPHVHYFNEHRRFAEATSFDPFSHDPYRIHAHFWSMMGRTDMAARVLRSIQHAQPKIETYHLLQKFELESVEQPEDRPISLPSWHDASAKPRILVFMHDYPDYGMDTLYHGLCTLLGKENVVEFPWKPTLHGQQFSSANNYPCVFHYPGEVIPIEQIINELKAGRFDLVVHADVVQCKYPTEIRMIMNAAKDIPVILYDTGDNCYTPLKILMRYLGGRPFDLIFKRELLSGIAYDHQAWPLPFSYPEILIPKDRPSVQKNTFFWAGKRNDGLRQLYLRYLEKRYGRRLNQQFDQETYRSILKSSLIGLSFFGCGFDTVRYWELPANRVMLLSERLPIQIPHNFVDGESAVFFDDLSDLEAKLDFYLNHPNEAKRIAAEGHKHYLRYHTTTARARQFLGVVSEAFGWQ